MDSDEQNSWMNVGMIKDCHGTREVLLIIIVSQKCITAKLLPSDLKTKACTNSNFLLLLLI